jgi:hypothetical protein
MNWDKSTKRFRKGFATKFELQGKLRGTKIEKAPGPEAACQLNHPKIRSLCGRLCEGLRMPAR